MSRDIPFETQYEKDKVYWPRGDIMQFLANFFHTVETGTGNRIGTSHNGKYWVIPSGLGILVDATDDDDDEVDDTTDDDGTYNRVIDFRKGTDEHDGYWIAKFKTIAGQDRTKITLRIPASTCS